MEWERVEIPRTHACLAESLTADEGSISLYHLVSAQAAVTMVTKSYLKIVYNEQLISTRFQA